MSYPENKAVRVKALSHPTLSVEFQNGPDIILDLTELLKTREIYWRLRQERYFKQVSLDPLGGICWPEGEDLAPDGLHRYQK